MSVNVCIGQVKEEKGQPPSVAAVVEWQNSFEHFTFLLCTINLWQWNAHGSRARSIRCSTRMATKILKYAGRIQ